MSNNDSYNYNTYIDNWALVEFCKVKKINPDCLKARHALLLSWLVKIQNEGSKFTAKSFKDGRYVMVQNKLISDNVKFIAVSNSSINKQIEELKKFGFISTENETNNTRYVRLAPELINLWNNKNYTTILSATEYLDKYKPNTLKGFKEKYSHIIFTDWLTVLANFNLGYSEGKQPMKVNSITHALRLYLDKCLHNDLEGTHRSQRF